ncbi:MAG: hypothetical protein JW747_08155 [Candidatus Aminicenantes bacterium]|nr:hypothetical protein [Candidatus Aminicenantes bacterium]
MSFKAKMAIFFVALLITFVGMEIFVRAFSADEILRMARQAGDRHLFYTQAPIHHIIEVM